MISVAPKSPSFPVFMTPFQPVPWISGSPVSPHQMPQFHINIVLCHHLPDLLIQIILSPFFSSSLILLALKCGPFLTTQGLSYQSRIQWGWVETEGGYWLPGPSIQHLHHGGSPPSMDSHPSSCTLQDPTLPYPLTFPCPWVPALH